MFPYPIVHERHHGWVPSRLSTTSESSFEEAVLVPWIAVNLEPSKSPQEEQDLLVIRFHLLDNKALVAVLVKLEQNRGTFMLSLFRKRARNRRNHPKVTIAIKAERVVARRDPDGGCNLEYGLETNSLFADEARRLAFAALGALADAADGLNILLGESALVAVDSEFSG